MYFSINKIKYVLFLYCKYRYSIYGFYLFINKKYVLKKMCIVKIVLYIVYVDYIFYLYMLGMKSN